MEESLLSRYNDKGSKGVGSCKRGLLTALFTYIMCMSNIIYHLLMNSYSRNVCSMCDNAFNIVLMLRDLS